MNFIKKVVAFHFNPDRRPYYQWPFALSLWAADRYSEWGWKKL